jgi:hypothetical protein
LDIPRFQLDGALGHLAPPIVCIQLLLVGRRPDVTPDEAHPCQRDEILDSGIGLNRLLQPVADGIKARWIVVVARRDPV